MMTENQAFKILPCLARDATGNPYCKEELIAEMGAAFLCGQSGIESTMENSAAYIQNWLEQLANDKKLIVQAAAQAQKASDFILGTKFDEAPASTTA